MKILLVTMEYPPDCGGVGNYYFNLVRNLTGHQIEIFKADKSSFYRFFWPKWLKLFFEIKKIIKKEKIDLIWVGQVLPVGEAVYLIKKFYKIPYFVSTHGMDIMLPQKSARKKMAMLKVLKEAEFMTANSRFTKKELLELGINDGKVEVVYPCSHVARSTYHIAKEDIEKVKKKLDLEDKQVLLTVGRLVKRKGQDLIIKIMPRLVEKFPNLVYLIIGDGVEKENLKFKIKNLKLDGQVFILDNVDNNELSAYYQITDVFVMPAQNLAGDLEGFGMVYLEAASFGLAVIAGNSGGVAEAVVDGQTGLLVNSEDENDIYEKIVGLLSDDGLRKRLGGAGQLRVAKEFQWSQQATALSNKIQEINNQ